MRNKMCLYPDYAAELDALDSMTISPDKGVDVNLLYRIINKHKYNAQYNKKLYERYKVIEEGLPIRSRKPRFVDEPDAINNRINNDFFGEIIDFKVGYFAGAPVSYSYSATQEAQETTGGEDAIAAATKALTDFVTRNNMYDIDMEITKFAAVCGYAARLFYIEEGTGDERCMVIEPFETIVLSNTELSEPKYALRYYKFKDIHDKTVWNVEFYDSANIYYYQGNLGHLEFIRSEPHMFDFCPLQIIPNNKELTGDAESVLELIDAYDREFSDCDNELESFARAYMVFENINASDEELKAAQKTGTIKIFTGSASGKAYFLTKDINDTFTDNQLKRTEDNIYRFSKTPNLNDDTFNSASGISLKFKLTGLETKCGMFQAKMQAAGTYMFKLLASAWNKKSIAFDPLQCVMDFKRNFPLDLVSEAQAATQMIAAGLPKRVAYSLAFSGIDDIDYVMQLIEEEQNDLYDIDLGDNGGDSLDERVMSRLTELLRKYDNNLDDIVAELTGGNEGVTGEGVE